MSTMGRALALAILGAALSGPVAADNRVEAKGALYTDIRLGYSGSWTSGGITSNAVDLHDDQSYWGLKASATSGDWSVFGQYERGLDTDNAFSGSSSSLPGGGFDLVRQAFLGVSFAPGGSLAAGTMETAYSKAARRYDPFYNTGVSEPLSAGLTPATYGVTPPVAPFVAILGAGQSFGGSVMSYPVLGGAFVKNQIAYTSPSFAGVTVNLAYFNDEEGDATAQREADLGAGVDWSWNGVNAGAQFLRIRDAAAPGSTSVNFTFVNGILPVADMDVSLIEGGYAADRFGGGITWERINYRNVAINDQDSFQVGGWFGLRPGTRLAATLGAVENLLDAAPGVGADGQGLTIGVFQDVIENFTVHAAFVTVDGKHGLGDTNGFTLGASYKFDLGFKGVTH